jgi:VIT1/CCC1 family predicted Fe2+/Mn2+ transporter
MDLRKENSVQKSWLKDRLDRVCTGYTCIEMRDLDKTLLDMVSEGLIHDDQGVIHATEQGMKLGKEWASLLLKKEPILEVVAGLVDGSITSLVVILSAFFASLALRTAVFAAFLTLSSVSITNFSSFLLGGITEDLADMISLQTLMDYSLSDIPDKTEREKSLNLVKDLFTLLHREISRSNLVAAIICGTTTFLAGVVPVITYFVLPKPLNLIASLAIVGVVVGVFLVRYRSRRSRVHWKVTLLETVVIVVIAVVASLLIGGAA